MSEAKPPRRLSVRQWLALDAAGTFLLGCGVFFYSGYLLCLDDSFGVVFVMVLYTIPLPLTLDLAALFLMVARSAFPMWRVMAAIGAAVQILAAVYHFWMWSFFWNEAVLPLLMLLVLAAGAAGLWAAIFSHREPKPSAE